ncbi:MAG: DMT family transporter [Bacteroidales bacterium]|nr:DMT family transporter [Bacteroidales bacterium]
MKASTRGFLYAFIATLCGSLVYLFSKAALEEVSLPQFGFYWFLTAIVFNSLMAAHPRGGFSLRSFVKADYRTLLYLGLIEIVATTTFYQAIAVSPNPSVPSFLRNLEYLFVTILGIWLLSERFGRYARPGAVLTIAGAFILSSVSTSVHAFLTGASGLMLVSTSFYAARTIIAKKHIREIRPVTLALNRALFLFVFAAFFVVITGDSLLIPVKAFVLIACGSFVGPFLTSIFQYSALRFIDASKAAIVQSTTGLFVLMGAFVVFGNLPQPVQIFGGMVTIAGVLLLMVRRQAE